MKTLKAIGLAVFAMLMFAVLAFGTANAETYSVKKGDCLSKIGKKYDVSWKVLARENQLKNPNLIFPRQKINIPENFEWEHANANPFKGTLDEALVLLGYPEEVSDLLKKVEVENDHFEIGKIVSGDKIAAMTFGKNIVKKDVISRVKKDLAVKIYTVTVQDKKYQLIYPLICGNWSRIDILIPAPETPKAPETILPPVEKEVQVPGESVTAPEEIPLAEVPEIKSERAIEHEPIIGAWIWDNKLAHGWGGYGEYMAWLREEYPWGYANGWSPGAGIYGYYSEGDTETSPHYWWVERGWGPQIGLKYIGETKEGKPWQWQAKLRYVWEHTHGENIAGYEMHQDNTKLGLYTEVLKRTEPKWIIGATAEGWYALDRDINSTWSGDKPSNRTTLAVNALAQYKMNDDWQVRGVIGPFYQGWDKLWGLRASAEARYKETVMFGPQLAIFPFGLSKVYDGIANAGDLTTLTGFVRVELGATVRNLDRNIRMEKVKKLDEKKYGAIEEEKTVQTIDNPENLVSINYTNPVPYISPTSTQAW